MATNARAQSYPGPTLGSGDIYVSPIASDYYGADPYHCSFSGAMVQAMEGRLDQGCAADGQFYGGGWGGWTEIDLPGNVYLRDQWSFFLGNTNIAIQYTGPGRASIDGASNVYPGFEVGYGGFLQFGSVTVTGYAAPPIQVDSGGTLSISGTAISGNPGNSGSNLTGGIYNNGGNVYVSYALIQNNGTAPGSKGGGIFNSGGTVYISDTSITGNTALEYGGAIENYNGYVNLNRVTVGQNSQIGMASMGEGGGGIYQVGGNAHTDIAWSTIVKNSAGESGGGINVAGGTITIKNSILADDQSHDNSDCTGSGTIVSGGFNLLGHCRQATQPPVGRPDILTSTSADGTAMLNPLSPETNSPPRYYSPRSGSPAIAAIPSTDPDCQGINGGSQNCDIGAYQP
jgi:hypothetical protein